MAHLGVSYQSFAQSFEGFVSQHMAKALSNIEKNDQAGAEHELKAAEAAIRAIEETAKRARALLSVGRDAFRGKVSAQPADEEGSRRIAAFASQRVRDGAPAELESQQPENSQEVLENPFLGDNPFDEECDGDRDVDSRLDDVFSEVGREGESERAQEATGNPFVGEYEDDFEDSAAIGAAAAAAGSTSYSEQNDITALQAEIFQLMANGQGTSEISPVLDRVGELLANQEFADEVYVYAEQARGSSIDDPNRFMKAFHHVLHESTKRHPQINEIAGRTFTGLVSECADEEVAEHYREEARKEGFEFGKNHCTDDLELLSTILQRLPPLD